MVVQPTGTVTLLFTDIEGSTRLLHKLGRERYAEALDLHRRLLRECFEAHDGYEVDCEGDAFFVAFSRAEDAVAAAADGQRELAEADWPDGCELRVRMGVHTGEPLAVPPKYVGIDVHRAARIMTAGHGGQVLLSAATVGLLDGTAVLRELGEHRLKDLSSPMRLYQIGEGEFPALKTLYRSNLPVPATPFLGRVVEVAEVEARLRDSTSHLLTLIGPGGTGKTRLALAAAAAAADAFPDGVTWVPLASLREPEYVVETIGQALDVSEEPGRPLLDSVCAWLAGQRRLILLDNAEHLLPAIAADLARLRDVGGVKLLVTSRERLRLEGEQTWPVPPLDGPDAVSLFTARAEAVDHSFAATAAVGELCERLDNLPLAVELAAARTSLFSPNQLLERLAQRLDLLKGGRDADPRHQTLRATIAWSYDLLDDREQRLLRSLSMFPGGCTFGAAERVCDADPETLESLLDKSLIRRRETNVELRFWMLETIREYAAERLDASGDSDAPRERHTAWYLALAEHAQSELLTRDAGSWLDRLDEEHSNIRAVLEWAFSEPEPDGDLVLRLTGAMWRFWEIRGHWSEGRRWLERALATPGRAPEHRIHALWGAGVMALHQVDDESAATHGNALLTVARDSGLPLGEAVALGLQGRIAGRAGDYHQARAKLEQGLPLAREAENEWLIALLLIDLGDVALNLGELERAVSLFKESLAIQDARGDGDLQMRAGILLNLGSATLALGDAQHADALFRESIAVAKAIDLRDGLLYGLLGLAAALTVVDPRLSARLLGSVDTAAEELKTEPENFEALMRERAVTTLRASLGEAAWTDAYEKGRALPLDAAVAEVLALPS